MNINDFMNGNKSGIVDIIAGLSNNFSSHDFIEKFSKKYESDYIEMLVDYKDRNAFQSVHAQIARFLSSNMETYGIAKVKKKSSEHIFGDLDVIQWWEKL